MALEVNGRVTVYDTLDHYISGFSQQQSGSSSLSFFSQHDLVHVTQLPVIPPDGGSQPAPVSESPSVPLASAREPVAAPVAPAIQAGSAQPLTQGVDIFAAIEKLGELKARGLLTEEEFTNKKADLLGRL